MVAFADAVVEGGGFVVESGFFRSSPLIAAPRTFLAGGYVDIDEDGEIGLNVAAGNLVESEDGVGIEAAAAALVTERGIGEAVTEYDGAAVERGTDDLFHILGAAGEVEKELGARGDFAAGGVKKNLADEPADFGAAWFNGFDDLAAFRAERFGEEAQLSGFAAAIDSFEGDERSAFGHALEALLSQEAEEAAENSLLHLGHDAWAARSGATVRPDWRRVG